MGFFNKIFSFMGFEDEKQKAKPKEKKLTPNKINASFELKSKGKKENKVESVKINEESEISSFIEKVKENGVAIADLSSFEKDKKIRAFDFISGAIFALEGQIEKLKPNVYICSLDQLDYFLGEEV